MENCVQYQGLEGISCERVRHSSGLTFLFCPMPGYSSAYALFATNYGSVDTSGITPEGKQFTIPDGTAHFLEHKLFEGKEGEDAFSLFAKTGASANAYTNFENTAYLFSASDHVQESAEILMRFVTSPWFTEENVAKEQGIIGQEIRMYDDSPGWQVFFGMLTAMYVQNPVRTDIAGTVETIAQITPQTLYDCYSSYYNLNNMVYVIAGNFDRDGILAAADRILPPAPAHQVTRSVVEEPDLPGTREVEKSLPVALPLFHLGFKERPKEGKEAVRMSMMDEMIAEICCGEASPLYRRLYDSGLINAEFGSEAFVGRGYRCNIFAGESREPKKVRDEILDELARLRREGIPQADFDRVKKQNYGRMIFGYNRVEGVASAALRGYFFGIEPFEEKTIAEGITLADLQTQLEESFREECSVLSVITPAGE
ncbi:MAG: insulinase family protein [Ruminococcaceae bacterium]|nr:insulinase family protein [Oscillospiraceae bacterium]